MSDKGIGIAIRRVKQLVSIVNEHLFRGDPKAILKIDLQQMVHIDAEQNLLNYRLRIMFRYPDSEEIVIDSTVSNVFAIEDLKSHLSESNKVNLPETVWVTMFSLATAHSRALISISITGTPFQEIILPLLNAADISKNLNPKQESEESEE